MQNHPPNHPPALPSSIQRYLDIILDILSDPRLLLLGPPFLSLGNISFPYVYRPSLVTLPPTLRVLTRWDTSQTLNLAKDGPHYFLETLRLGGRH